MKPEKGWQKKGIIGLFFLYIVLGIVFCVQRTSALGEQEGVAVMGNNVTPESEQASDNYKEIKKVALTFDADVIIGLSQESSINRVVSVI